MKTLRRMFHLQCLWKTLENYKAVNTPTGGVHKERIDEQGRIGYCSLNWPAMPHCFVELDMNSFPG